MKIHNHNYKDFQGKPKYSEKPFPSATLSTTNSTRLDPGLNPGRCGGKPETNRLSYGAASLLLFTQNKEICLKRPLLFQNVYRPSTLSKEWTGITLEHSKTVILCSSPAKRTAPHYTSPSVCLSVCRHCLSQSLSLSLCSIDNVGLGRDIELRYRVRQNYFKLD
jgi:hypothetical protein